jgi:predicted DNA-binding transcriptional regulator YafY
LGRSDPVRNARVSKRSGTETVGRIFLAFLEKTTWSQFDLARKVDVSVRVARRCLEELARGGMPLEREEEAPHVLWTVPNGWFPEGLTLTKADAAQVVRFIARSPKSAARDALLKNLVRTKVSGVITPNEAPLEESEEILATLENARATRRAVRLHYETMSKGVKSWRHVSVQHVQYGERTRFLAFCHRNKALRQFRVSQVVEAKLVDGVPFVRVPEDEIVARLAGSIDGWFDEGPPRAVAFAVYGDDARWVQANLPSKEMTVETCEGGIRVKGTTTAIVHVARFVVGLGGSAVAETPELADAVEKLATGALARAARRAGSGGKGVVKAWKRGGAQERKAERVP